MSVETIEIEHGLTDEDVAVRDTAHRFAEEVLRPAGRELDQMHNPADVVAPNSILWDVFKKYHALEFSHLITDEEMDPVAKARMMYLINEELAWGDVGLAITLGLCQFHVPWVNHTGDKELIERFCNPDKPTVGCWALTEPDHGSNTIMMGEPFFSDPSIKANCTAKKLGNQYIINGQKAAWVSNGAIADIAVLFTTADPSQGLKGGGIFLVPLDLPGVSRPKPLDKLGQRSLNQSEIFFDEVRIPESYMALGPDLYTIGLETMLCHANAGMGQIFVGLARAGYDFALEYAKQRIQGGVPIIEHQSVRSRLFKMFMKVEAARSLTRRVGLFNAAGAPKLQHCIAAKVFCTNTSFEVASEAVQIFGGNGMSREYPIEKIFRDARASLIEDGCNEVLSIIGGSRL